MRPARRCCDGMAEASRRYGVPVVGGHSNHRSPGGQLAVAILGRAKALLTSFDARPGDALMAAVDLRGEWQDPYPYWNASTSAPGPAAARRPRAAAAAGRSRPVPRGQGHQHGRRGGHGPDAAGVLGRGRAHRPRRTAAAIACGVVGEVDASRQVKLRAHGEEALLWDFASDAFIQPPTLCATVPATVPEAAPCP
jgi:hypothetical protein